MTQRIDLADRQRAARDRQVGKHLAPVMKGDEPMPGQRTRQRGSVRQHPRRRRPACDTPPCPPTSTPNPFDHTIESTGKMPLHPRLWDLETVSLSQIRGAFRHYKRLSN